MRFGLFHVLQASARAERRAIAGKGLTGPGYDGHAFWDTEGFVLPVLTYTSPHAAADALRWRASTLDLARERAAELDLEGAAFPWRTIRGQECSAYWPAGTAAWHVNADIADGVRALPHRSPATSRSRPSAAWRCWSRPRGCGMSLGHHDRHGVWHLDGVTGPDEYTAVVRDNVFTNLMAAHNLRVAADGVRPPPRGGPRAGRRPPRRRPPGATPPTPCTSRTTRSSACTRSARASPRCAEWDFTENTDVPAAAARALRSAVPGAGDQAGRPGAGDALAGPRVHRRSRRPATSTTTSGAPCATRRCRRAPRR